MRDKSLVYINVDSKGLYIDKIKGYGPFKKTRQLEELIIRIRNLYPITSLDIKYSPLISSLDASESYRQIEFLNSILSCKHRFKDFILEIDKKMISSAKFLDYELASYYRDLQSLLKSLSYSLFTLPILYSKNIFFYIPIDSHYKLFLVNAGQIIDSKIVEDITIETLQLFKKDRELLFSKNLEAQYTKAQRTIMDVIYSEIRSYPESWFF